LQAIKHKFNPGRNSDFVENAEQIISNDSGSTLLGFTVAFLALDFYRASGPAPAITTVFFPFMAAALPLLDAVLAVLRRLLNRGSMIKGDRRHFYDLLLACGWSTRKVLFASLGASSAISVIATACLRCSPAQAALLAIISIIALIVWIVRLGSLQATEESRKPVEEVQS
jgi:UDP-GlcNAc:undecaprenyl-phosphate/decaprenyl-phosphate GlcNAc-1-phosphate transferase